MYRNLFIAIAVINLIIFILSLIPLFKPEPEWLDSELHPFMQATITEVECFGIKSNEPTINCTIKANMLFDNSEIIMTTSSKYHYVMNQKIPIMYNEAGIPFLVHPELYTLD